MDIENFINHKYINSQYLDDLVIFNYSSECQFDRAWDHYTKSARGLIFDKTTGKLISRPFPKFFNLNEMPETQFNQLPNEPFTVTEKLDGVLGISYFHKNKWKIATRGSFTSEYAIWATNWLNQNVNTFYMDRENTYLFEIIYPGSRIVVDYEGQEKLVLLGIIETQTGKEFDYDLIKTASYFLNVEVTNKFECNSISELVAVVKQMSHNEEGFVVTFANGLKVKIKSEEYKRVHKLIQYMTPIAFWEAWEYKSVDGDPERVGILKQFLGGLPEEYRSECDLIARLIHQEHMQYYYTYKNVLERILSEMENPTAKQVALRAKQLVGDNMSFVMYLFNNKMLNFWFSVHNRVRPTRNQLNGYECKLDR